MEAIENYNTDSDNDSGDEEVNSETSQIQILEGSSVSLKPVDFFGLENNEDSDEPLNKKIKCEKEDKNDMVIVQGNPIEIPKSDFWKDMTHKQIVFINNSNSCESHQNVKPGKTIITSKNSNHSKRAGSVNSTVKKTLETSAKNNSGTSSTFSTNKPKYVKAKPVNLIPLKPAVHSVSDSVPLLSIIPSSQTSQNIQEKSNFTGVLSNASSQVLYNIVQSPQTVQAVIQSSHAAIPSTNTEATNVVQQIQVSGTDSTLRAMLNSPFAPLQPKHNTSCQGNNFPTPCLISNIPNTVQIPIQTLLIPVQGDQPAKLVQLFPTNSPSGQNVPQKNVKDNQPQTLPSVVPLINLIPATQQITLLVPSSQSSDDLTQRGKSDPNRQVPGAQQLQDLAMQFSSQDKMKSELLRLLQCPVSSLPVTLNTSTLEATADNTQNIQTNANSFKRTLPKATNSDFNKVFSGNEMFNIEGKVTCLLNKPVIKKKPPTRLERSFFGHVSMINRIKWNQSQYSHLLLSASMDGTFKVYNGLSSSNTDAVLQVCKSHSKAIKDAEWNGEGRSVLTCSFDQTAVITDVETGNILCKLPHDSFVSCGKFHPLLDKTVVTGSKNLIQTWDIRMPDKPVRIFKYKDKLGQIQDVLFCKDGQQLFSASGVVSRDSADRSIMAWDCSTGAVLSNQIFQERYLCTRLKLHPVRDLFLSQTQGGYIAIFSTKYPYDMVWSRRYEGHKTDGYDIGFDISTDGSVVVSGSTDGILHCYSNFTGKLWRTLKTGFDVCLDAAFHPVLPSTVACCSTQGQIKIFH